MARAEKVAAVTELADELRNSAGAVLTEYRGLTVRELQELRRELGENAHYVVVKNRLTKLAAQEAGVDAFEGYLTGPSAIAFIKGDAVEAAKGLRNFARTHSPLVIKAGVLEGKPLTAAEISRIADLESREVLLARLAGAFKASLQEAASVLQAPLSQAARLAGALQAKAEEDPTILAGGAAAEATGQGEATEVAEEAQAAAETPAAEEAQTDEETQAGEETPAAASDGTADERTEETNAG